MQIALSLPTLLLLKIISGLESFLFLLEALPPRLFLSGSLERLLAEATELRKAGRLKTPFFAEYVGFLDIDGQSQIGKEDRPLSQDFYRSPQGRTHMWREEERRAGDGSTGGGQAVFINVGHF